MPGDDLLPDAASTTRAITIAAPAEQVWPWLVQLGYGRAGWHSYAWIDSRAEAMVQGPERRLCRSSVPYPADAGTGSNSADALRA